MRITNRQIEKADRKSDNDGFNPIQYLSESDIPDNLNLDETSFEDEVEILDNSTWEKIIVLDGYRHVYRTADGKILIVGDAHGAWAKDVTEFFT